VDLSPWPPSDVPADLPPPWPDAFDVPYVLDTLPDGTEALVLADRDLPTDHLHLQGDNDYGFEGTCGLCACQDVLNQFGIRVSENDVVRHAVDHGQCRLSDHPLKAGGIYAFTVPELLADYGIPSHLDYGDSLEDLAAEVEQDRGVIIGVNAGLLGDDGDITGFGGRDHAVTVVDVVRDAMTYEIRGFKINDSGTGTFDQYVDADTMTLAWLDTGGELVTTDITRAEAPAFAGGNV
jgi:hypothetical protein